MKEKGKTIKMLLFCLALDLSASISLGNSSV